AYLAEEYDELLRGCGFQDVQMRASVGDVTNFADDLLAIIAGAFDRGEASYAVWLFKVLKDLVDTPFSIVLAFYFAAHVVRAWNEGKQ
ncbi:MAG: hypothetical protein ACWGQW_22675, partial [bacterium]